MNQRLPTTSVRPLPAFLSSEGLNGILPNDDSSGELRTYLNVVVKYKVLIGASILGTTLLALLYAFTVTPLYLSTSKVRIGTYEPVLSATRVEDVLEQKSKEGNYLETQLEEMVSFSLADKVLNDTEVKNALSALQEKKRGFFSSLFGSSQPSPDLQRKSSYKNNIDEIQAYLSAVDVKPVRRTSIVDIDVTSPDPRVAALIANKHAESYIEWVRDNRIEQQARGLTFLRTQAEELRDKVGDLERELNEYAEANSIVALNKDENITVQKMSQLNQLLTMATGKKIDAENTYKQAEAAPSAGFDDVSAQTMRTELANLQSQYSELGQKFTSNYPKMKQLKSQIDDLRRSIEGQRKQIVLGLKAKADAAADEEKRLREELEKQKSQAFELSKRQVQYNVLNRELMSSRELLQSVLKQIKETSLAVESNASNISIVDRAVAPLFASYPHKRLFVLIGLAIGAALGMGLAFLINYLDNTVRTPEQLTEVINLPSLGVVPSFDSEKKRSRRDAPSRDILPDSDLDGEESNALIAASSARSSIMFLKDPRSLASEAYRTIRTGLLLSQAGEPPRTILVSSAQSAEGKTTSSVNIAVCLASAGGRVVIVDADLRRPSVYRHLGINPKSPGLVEVLTGSHSLESVILPNVIKRLSVIPSGKIPPNPAELLGSLEMATLIDTLASMYDYVIIDSPPVLPVTDSVILSRYVDGVVLVVKGAMTPKKVVRDAKDRLRAVGARFLGAILNNVDISSGEYYYYNRYYYSYYKNEEDDEVARRAAL